MMRVLVLDVNCEYSSTGKIAYNLFSSLNEDGYEANIVYGRGPLVEKPGVYKFGLDWETYVHALLTRITGRNGCYSHFSTRRLINYIKEYKPDVVHIHELHAYFVNISELLQFLAKEQIPVVWTFHCEFMYTGKCGFAFECTNYKNGCGNCPYVHEYVKTLFFDRTRGMLAEKKKCMSALNIKAIATPSKWLADRTRETYLGKFNIQVVHNGIDTNGVFYPRTSGEELRNQFDIPKDKRLILAVAPNIMEPRKGGQTVLDLAATMPDTHFVLVGTDETKRYADNVQLISRTRNQDELAEWYSAADLFIICSTAENFPTTCIEALCCGTPVVGLDLGGTSETAESPYGNFVKVNIDDTSEVNKAAILQGLSDAIATQLARNLTTEEVRKYAVEHYDNKVMYNQYLNIYKE